MIGKRVIIMKRPAVLCAAAFVVGIAVKEYLARSVDSDSAWPAIGIAGCLLAVCLSFLRRLRKGRRQVSIADKLLLLTPVFLLAGYFIMGREMAVYEKNVAVFTKSMEGGREILAEGTVSHIRQTESGIRLELKNASVSSYYGEAAIYRPVGKLLVYTDDIVAENGEIKHGQRIFVYGNGSIFEKATNPGCFDAKEYYFSLGITGAIQGKSIRITNFSYHRLNQALFQAKSQLLNSYATYLGEENAGVISSMLMGERALVSDETRELYRRGGISHILAISGLHVSMIGMALYKCLRKTILGRNGAIPAACMGVVLYGTFVETGTSTKRAVIMFLLLLLATALGRTYDTLSAMSVSVIGLLCRNPGALYTASFQLSYAAAYGASVLAVILQEQEKERRQKKGSGQVQGNLVPTAHGDTEKHEVLEEARQLARRLGSKKVRFFENVKDRIKTMFLFGLAIQVVTFPFTVYHFFEYPVYGFLLNPVVVPLMTILLFCGLLSGVFGLFLSWAGYFFAGGVSGILWIYETLCRLVERLPYSLLLFGRPVLWQIGLYFLLLVLFLFFLQGNSKRRTGRGTCGPGKTEKRVVRVLWSRFECLLTGMEKKDMVYLVLLLLPLALLPIPGAKTEITFLDVGQGDGIILRERNGAVLLIDGGSTSVQKVGEKRLIPYLKSKAVRTISCAFVSHTDTDHISGMKEILEAMPKYSAFRESIAGYTGTPVIKSIVLPELYGSRDSMSENWKAESEFAALEKLAREKNVAIYYMSAGDQLKVGKELIFTCLAPEQGRTYESSNAASMVLLASCDGVDALFTGDMDKAGEARLLNLLREENYRNTRTATAEIKVAPIDVLKVAHHGSNTASSEELLEKLQPRISVISCGKGNRYGHPHEETIKRLEATGSRILRTDELGAIILTISPSGEAKKERYKHSVGRREK